MSATFWRQIHGGSTHFPIALLLASVVFDFIASRSRDEGLRRGLHTAGFGSAVVGMLGAIGAATAGLIMTHGRMLGSGYERIHHRFVWPAIISCGAFVAWRVLNAGPFLKRGPRIYFAGMSIAAALMVGAGYSGGAMLLAAEKGDVSACSSSGDLPWATGQATVTDAGRQLFLRNCAHCHGADAHGDEGPDLHKLDWSDEQITTRIRNGKKGQMPAFAGKLSPPEINQIITYLRTLK